MRALEALTGRRDLRFLTLLTWTDVLPVQQLQRRSRAWCPACYTAWRQADRPVYDPLLWTLEPVTICPHHRRRLRLVCPYPDCQRAFPWLSSRSRPGCCARCGRWLGDGGPLGAPVDAPLPAAVVQEHAWSVQAVGDLIAAAPGLTGPPRREQLARTLTASGAQRSSGNRSAWARELGLRAQTVADWCHGAARPSLWLLLELCDRLGTTPRRLLCGEDEEASCTPGASAAPQRRPPRPAWTHTAIEPEAVRAALEAILASEEQPPPSLREVAQRLGQTYANLRHHLPELSRAIAERYRSDQEAQGARTRQRLREEVREAVLYVHRQGVYPSSYRVAGRLSQPGSMRSQTARAAWHEALRDLGWQT
ncbi:MAG TPA: TniQ family protein [Chloroflexota bacterium]